MTENEDDLIQEIDDIGSMKNMYGMTATLFDNIIEFEDGRKFDISIENEEK